MNRNFRKVCDTILCGWLGLVITVCAQSDLTVYTDVLVNGWQNWSWATVNLTNLTPAHSGSASISVTAAAWQAVYLEHAAFNTSPYTNFTFWIHGGATGGQQLQVLALTNGVPLPAVPLAVLPANTWQQITLSLAALGVSNNPNVDGFYIQDRSGTSQPTFYLDDISLTATPVPAVIHLGVNATQTVRVVDARIFGLNTAVWDSVLDTTNTIGLLQDMANQALRFPGGSLADDYNWVANTTGTNTWQWTSAFNNFVDVATNTQAQVFITVNYGSSTPAAAAAWVQQANIANHLAFKYWEIGNENYGTWETDTNAQPHDPFTYATRFKDYVNQMKAVDPTIKIGAVSVTGEDSYANYSTHPATNSRTHVVHNGWTPVMLTTMKMLGVTPDFLIYHRYEQAPGAENDATLLQAAGTWSNDAADLRQQLNDYLGSAATNVELDCTENNSIATNPGKQTTSLVNGLYLADSLGHILQTEFNTSLWWDLRNGQETGNNNDAALYGWRQYGDYGIMDSANPAHRYPTFYVAKLLKYFARGGDRVVSTTSDYPLLTAFAAQHQDSSLSVLVINKHPTATLTANLTLTGYVPNSNAVVYSYGIPQDNAAQAGSGSPDVAQTNIVLTASGTNLTFAPYSVTVLTLYNNSRGARFYLQDAAGNVTRWVVNNQGVLQLYDTLSGMGAWNLKALGDVTHDGLADLFWQMPSGWVVAWLSQTNSPYQGIGLGNLGAWELRAAADVDGDGIADLIWQHSAGWVSIWYMDSNCTQRTGVSLGNLGGWRLKAAADITRDGKADLFWQNNGWLTVWLSQTNGTYQGLGLGNLGAWELRAAADVDGDGIPDLIWQTPDNWVAIWYMNSNCTPRAGAGLGNTGTAKIMAVE